MADRQRTRDDGRGPDADPDWVRRTLRAGGPRMPWELRAWLDALAAGDEGRAHPRHLS